MIQRNISALCDRPASWWRCSVESPWACCGAYHQHADHHEHPAAQTTGTALPGAFLYVPRGLVV